jgi:hypothetical protein
LVGRKVKGQREKWEKKIKILWGVFGSISKICFVFFFCVCVCGGEGGGGGL